METRMPRPAGLTQQPTKQKKVNYLIRHYIQNGNQVNNQYLSTQELSILLRINQNQTLKLIRQQTIKLARLYAISQPIPKNTLQTFTKNIKDQLESQLSPPTNKVKLLPTPQNNQEVNTTLVNNHKNLNRNNNQENNSNNLSDNQDFSGSSKRGLSDSHSGDANQDFSGSSNRDLSDSHSGSSNRDLSDSQNMLKNPSKIAGWKSEGSLILEVDRSLILRQLQLLMKAQNGTYKPFISSEVTRCLALLAPSSKNRLELYKIAKDYIELGMKIDALEAAQNDPQNAQNRPELITTDAAYQLISSQLSTSPATDKASKKRKNSIVPKALANAELKKLPEVRATSMPSEASDAI